MIEDEKFVEKVAEAMWNTTWAAEAGVSWDEAVSCQGAIIEDFRKYARAAIAAVREHDKEQGLVHADSTGAVDGHASDCAIHNQPAYPAGPCDCGYQSRRADLLVDRDSPATPSRDVS